MTTQEKIRNLAYEIQDEDPQLAAILLTICGSILAGTINVLGSFMKIFAKKEHDRLTNERSSMYN